MKFKLLLILLIGVAIAVSFYIAWYFATGIDPGYIRDQDNWTRNFIFNQFTVIKKEPYGILMVQDGGINGVGIISNRKLNLAEGEYFDLHRHSEGIISAKITGIGEKTFNISYNHSFCSEFGYGCSQILGSLEIPYTPEWTFAIYSGNISYLRSMLDSGLDVNSRDKYGRTPLIFAAYYQNKDMVKLLLDSGADINAKNNEVGFMIPRGYGVLDLARDDSEIMKTLIFEDPEKSDFLVLRNSIILKNISMINSLLEMGVDINSKSDLGYTPLMLSIDDLKTFKFLIRRGADPTIKDVFGKDVVFKAINTPAKCPIEIVNILNSTGLHIDQNIIKNNYYETLLSARHEIEIKTKEGILLMNEGKIEDAYDKLYTISFDDYCYPEIYYNLGLVILKYDKLPAGCESALRNLQIADDLGYDVEPEIMEQATNCK